jgi:iron complex outermembrane receptor protein
LTYPYSGEKCTSGLFLLLFAVVLQGAPLDSLQNPTSSLSLKEMSLEELSQIEVTTPSKEPVPAFRTPVAISVITAEQIRRSGATSIPEALRLSPGVEVARIDGNKWAIGIRGFGDRFSRGVLVLIDGRTVYTPLLAGTYWEVQDTMMEDIDRIEVICGPGGTIWGPNAVNGVINIITKNSKDTNGMLATAGGGNEEQGFAGFRYGGGNGRNLNYRVYGKGFTRGPEDHPDHQNFDDWRAAQAGFRLDWARNKAESLTLQGDMYTEEAGESVSAISYTPPYSTIANANADLSGGNVMARWTKAISDGNDIQIQTYYDRTNRHEPNFGDLRNTFDVDFLQHLHLAERNEVSWGLGARFSLADNIQVVSGLTFLPNKRTDQLFTGFLQDDITLIQDKVTLTLGTKALHTNFTGAGFEPSGRLLWTPDQKQTVWAAYTHALRTPSDAEENFYLSGYIGPGPNGTQFFARFNANSHFAPEQLNGYEFGYRRLIGSTFYLGLAAFYNHYHNLVDEEITGSVYLEDNPPPAHLLLPAQFGNGLLGTTKGGEIAPSWQILPFWQMRGSYSFLQMDVEQAPLSRNVQSLSSINGASPRHEVPIHSSMDLPKKLSFDVDWRYVSALTGQLVPAYSTADARLAWKYARDWELALVGRNLLQPAHGEYRGDPGPLVEIRRSAYAKLTWMR